jgi:hypothetical protein
MSGQPAASGAALVRVVVVEGGTTHDVFEVLDERDGVVYARSAFLFEIGEEIKVQLERDGAIVDAIVRVRGHVDRDGAKISELELVEQGEPRPG